MGNIVTFKNLNNYGNILPDHRTFVDTKQMTEALGGNLTAGSILSNTNYFVIAEMLRYGTWRNLKNRYHVCGSCGEQTNNTECCEFCGGVYVGLEEKDAFTDKESFIDWCTQSLSVTKRTIDNRYTYISNYLNVGLTVNDAFHGIAVGGINWLNLVRQINRKVAVGSMGVDEAKQLLVSPDSMDPSTMVAYTKQLSGKDSVHVTALDNTPNFIAEVLDPEGSVILRMMFVGIFLENTTKVREDDFFGTQLGMAVARKLKVNTPVANKRTLTNLGTYYYDLLSEWGAKLTFLKSITTIFNKLMTQWPVISRLNLEEPDTYMDGFRNIATAMSAIGFEGSKNEIKTILSAITNGDDETENA